MFKRKINRLTKFDYSSPNYYFVTVCTKGRMEFFDEIQNGEINLSNEGVFAQKFWQEIPKHYQNVDLDEFVIMSNHIHGILVLKPAEGAEPPSLSKMMSAYKNISGKEIRKFNPAFGWQKSFYDHVIRRDESLDKIREYIRNNPQKWELDRNNPQNLWM